LDEGLSRVSTVHGRPVYLVGRSIPLVGHIAFGVIDRGTNILQVRPSTLCPHNCIYCSVDAGPGSTTRQAEYLVDAQSLASWATSIAETVKKGRVEMLIDGVGEPLTHPKIAWLVETLSSHPYTWRVAVETHGGFLTRTLVRRLAEAGLQRINLSLDTLNPGKAKLLSGAPWYNVERVAEIVEWAVRETSVDVVLTPVIVPGVNEEDIYDLVRFAEKNRLGEKTGWPTGVLPQKYEAHKYGRKPRGVREWTWHKFYSWLRRVEEETGYNLTPSMEELGYRRMPALPTIYRRGERVALRPVGPGWHKGETLAVDTRGARVFSLYCTRPCKGRIVKARVARVKDNIYVAIH